MLEKILRIWRPESFHGFKKRHFEGWYIKLVDKKKENIFAIIPGVAIDQNSEKDTHSFIQVYNGKTGEYNYHRFDIQSFKANNKKFDIKIESNVFNNTKINLNINKAEQTIIGTLNFTNLVHWPIKLLSPGAMGPFAFVPKMECSHGVLSFDHEINGSLSVNGDEIDFTGGRGFIGKEWGVSHPSSWIWIQSNHFSENGISLSVSIANVPYLYRSFPGFIIGFLHNGKIHQFTSYNRAKIHHLSVDRKIISIDVIRKNYILKIRAFQEEGTELVSPKFGKMSSSVVESLISSVNIEFIKFNKKKKMKKLIFSGTGYPAGLEVKGDIKELISLKN